MYIFTALFIQKSTATLNRFGAVTDLVDSRCGCKWVREASLGTNPASGVNVQVLEDVNIFGGHADFLEKEPEGISVKRIQGGFKIDIGYIWRNSLRCWGSTQKARMQSLVKRHGVKPAC